MNRRSLLMSLWAAVAAPFVGSGVAAKYGEGECLLELEGRGPEVGPLDLSNPNASSRWRYIATVEGVSWRHGKDQSWTPFLDRKEAISVARKILDISAMNRDAVLIRLHPDLCLET